MFFRCLTGRSGSQMRCSKVLSMIGIAMAANSAPLVIDTTPDEANS